MEHIAPLLQTIIWVSLTGAIFYCFHNNLSTLLDALAKRINSGSGFKVGPIELSELKSQDLKEQSDQLENELKQISQIDPKKNHGQAPNQDKISSFTLSKSVALQAEDLAMREVQAEFGVPIGRQLQTGGLRFDGFFAVAGTAHIVEIKFSHGKFRTQVAKTTIERIVQSVGRYGWKNYKIIIVIVYASDDVNLQEEESRFFKENETYNSIVQFRLFKISELKKKFGIAEENLSKTDVFLDKTTSNCI